MEFALSSEQIQLQATLDRALSDLASLDKVRAVADGRGEPAQALWRGLTALGVSGLILPEAHGGLGLDLLDAALVSERLGRHVAPPPFAGSAVMAPIALLAAGSPEQQARWLPALADGSARAGVAITEWVSGARDGAGVHADGGALTGSALVALGAQGADVILVADTVGRLHLVEAGAHGLTVEILPSVDTTRPNTKVTFAGTPAEALPGDGPAALARMRDAAWVMIAADTLGAAQMMLEKAVAYAHERRQFGRAIGSFQAVKHLCAEMAAELEPCRALVWYAAYALSRGEADGPLAAAHAKAHLSEVGRFVARTATEVHGGIGFTDLSGLPFWFRRIEANRQLLGGPERVRRHAARWQGFTA